jgi:hypothetical protein
MPPQAAGPSQPLVSIMMPRHLGSTAQAELLDDSRPKTAAINSPGLWAASWLRLGQRDRQFDSERFPEHNLAVEQAGDF